MYMIQESYKILKDPGRYFGKRIYMSEPCAILDGAFLQTNVVIKSG